MEKRRNLLIYTVSHFAADFICFYLLLGVFSPSFENLTERMTGYLAYNAIAFGVQPVIGWLYDKKTFRLKAGTAGMFLIAAGAAFSGFLRFQYAGLALYGLGNAFFHIGGGADTLRRSGGRSGPNGIFVAGGALGVSLGTFAGKNFFSPIAAVAAALIFAALIQLFCKESAQRNFEATSLRKESAFAPILALCSLTIVFRAYIGLSLSAPWQAAGIFIFLGSICAALGKAAGGFVGDFFGERLTGSVTLIISAALFFALPGNAAVFALALILFNMTMPLTLTAIAGLFPDSPGFSFGLTTLALLFGTIPAFFFKLPEGASPAVCAALALISSICLFFALPKKAEHDINQTGGLKL